eukprot:CAMPEP_0179442588 /NCGR_PEP_ID=MMETSP0799-20121207/26095_1 /TAXON_ID=46947 /ORGANISM="Geminigera cryophila, Strain CCMP2564" /LENGTH=62 /DNA_ID=CAMNT_0021227903 /DNA_START=1 /DNA_END=189 /DNA_ORIENTATION=+
MDPIFIWFGVASATGTTAIATTQDCSEFDSLGNRKPVVREEEAEFVNPAYSCDYGYSIAGGW